MGGVGLASQFLQVIGIHLQLDTNVRPFVGHLGQVVLDCSKVSLAELACTAGNVWCVVYMVKLPQEFELRNHCSAS